MVADALLSARGVLAEQLGKLQKRLVSLARQDTRARLLMSTPGVGVLVALTYVSGDRRSRTVQKLQGCWRTFRTYAKEISIGRD